MQFFQSCLEGKARPFSLTVYWEQQYMPKRFQFGNLSRNSTNLFQEGIRKYSSIITVLSKLSIIFQHHKPHQTWDLVATTCFATLIYNDMVLSKNHNSFPFPFSFICVYVYVFTKLCSQDVNLELGWPSVCLIIMWRSYYLTKPTYSFQIWEENMSITLTKRLWSLWINLLPCVMSSC